MKKLLILSAALVLSYSVKAQDLVSKYMAPQVNSIKIDTAISAFTGKLSNTAELRNKAFTNNLAKDALNKAYLDKLNNSTLTYDDTVYSTMPIAGNKGNNRMPIVKPGDANTKYTMLVKRIDIVNPTKKAKEEKIDVER